MNYYIGTLIVYIVCVLLGSVVFKHMDPEQTSYKKAFKFMSIGFAIGFTFIGLVFLIVAAIMGE